MAQKYKEKQDKIKEDINEFMKQDLALPDNSLSPPKHRHIKDKMSSDLSVKSTKQLRDEIKNRKQALREVARVQASSKIGLSKLVTTLEKQTLDDEKKIDLLNHKLSQATKEKQMFKQKYPSHLTPLDTKPSRKRSKTTKQTTSN